MKEVNGWHLMDGEEDPGYKWWSKERENWQNGWIKFALQHTRGQRRTAIDIGAAYGSTSRIFAKRFEKVEAFEINTGEQQKCYYLNMEPYRNYVLHNKGLWSKETEVAYEHYKWSGKNRISQSATLPGRYGDIDDFKKFESKPVYTLDSFNFQNVDLIKIDVEGAEGHVLWGARETIDKWHPNIIVEVQGLQNGMRYNESLERYGEPQQIVSKKNGRPLASNFGWWGAAACHKCYEVYYFMNMMDYVCVDTHANDLLYVHKEKFDEWEGKQATSIQPHHL